MLGLCARAGKLVSGEEMCVKAIRKGRVMLALLDETASHNARKTITDACAAANVPLYTLPEGQLGQAIGKPNRMAVGIEDPSFAAQLIKLFS